MNRIEIENRLIEFTIKVINLCRNCEFDQYTGHLLKQITRSSSSSALNYGEAQSAESSKDFLHKLSLVLKELRETQINIKILKKSGVCKNDISIEDALNEANELVAIFQKSVNTARKRR